MQDVSGSGKCMLWQLIIHFLFALSFKTAKSNSRIRRTEEPDRTAAKTIPYPNKTDRKVEHPEVPKLPIGQSLKKFLYSHCIVAKIEIEPIIWQYIQDELDLFSN